MVGYNLGLLGEPDRSQFTILLSKYTPSPSPAPYFPLYKLPLLLIQLITNQVVWLN